MKMRAFYIFAVLLALVLIISPAVAAPDSTQLQGIKSPRMKIFTPHADEKTPNTALLTAVVARAYGSHYNGYIRCFL